MSHVLFGDFQGEYSDINISRSKKEMEQHGILVFFDEEISSCHEVKQMLVENGKWEHSFLITSSLQRTNSDDILFPYDKYTNCELFPQNGDRSFFESACNEGLSLLSHAMEVIISDFDIQRIRVFVTDGYDSTFQILNCTLPDMINDILVQVKSSYFLTSKIYNLINM